MADLQSLLPEYCILAPTIGPGGRTCHALDPARRPVFLKRARTPRAGIREARALRALRSPFFPALQRVLRREGHIWLVMERLEGAPLSEGAPPSPEWPSSLARVLIQLHRSNWVHGDLKPENVWLHADGRVSLIDFDYALPTGEELDFEEAGGTPGFVAPERLSGWPADPRSDIYALGVLLERLAPPSTPGALDDLGLRRPTPGERPAQLDQRLDDLVRLYGPGVTPGPDLRFAGWFEDEEMPLPRLEELLARHLGIDHLLGSRVAGALRDLSAGHQGWAQELWRAWLSEFHPDPFEPPSDSALRNALPRLAELGRPRIAGRLNALPERVRQAAGDLAWMGFAFDPIEVAATLESPQEPEFALGPRLAELQAAGLVRRSGGKDSAGWEFCSRALWREARELLSPSRRRLINQRALDALSARDPAARSADHAARIAAHAVGTGDLDVAAREYLTFALESYLRARSPALVDEFEAGLAALRELHPVDQPETAGTPGSTLWPGDAGIAALQRWDLLVALAEYASALGLAGRLDDGIAWIRRWHDLELSESLRALGYQIEAEIHQRRRDAPSVMAAVEKGLGQSAMSDSTRGRLHIHRAQVLVARGQLIAADPEIERARDLLDSAGDLSYRGIVPLLRGNISYRSSDYLGARMQWDSALALARVAGNVPLIAGVHVNLAAAEWLLKDGSSARRHLSDAMALARSHRILTVTMDSLLLLAEMARSASDWEESYRQLLIARQLSLESGNLRAYLNATALLGRTLNHAGKLGEAERRLMEPGATAPADSAEREERLILFYRMEIRVWLRRVPFDPGSLGRLGDLVRASDVPRDRERLAAYRAAHEVLEGVPTEQALQTLGPAGEDPELRGWWFMARSRIQYAAGDAAGAVASLLSAQESFRRAGNFGFEVCLGSLEHSLLEFSLNEPIGRALAHDTALLARSIRARWLEARALILCRDTA